MKKFLEYVADDLFGRFANSREGLSRVTVVFPNRRARLFFNDYLSKCSVSPIWSPQYTTIQDMFQNASALAVADRIELVSLLHKVYKDVMKCDESLDSFWPWGEILLADFDDVDRNMADAGSLFGVLAQQHELSDLSFLTEEQTEALSAFFGKLGSDDTSRLKQELLNVWNSLGEIYSRFVSALEGSGLAYSGLMQRRVIENLDVSLFSQDHYAFVGFNSLDKAERELFRAIQSQGKALFYWDYDIEYTQKNSIHEAGHFMRSNLEEFPSELHEELFDNLSRERKLRIVDASTDCAQARYIPQWLETVGRDKADSEMAVVLCDESLLQSVLHSLPSKRMDNVNVTMGYPMTATPLFSLIMALVELQHSATVHGGRFCMPQVEAVLSNPLMSMMSANALGLLSDLRKSKRMYPSPSELEKDEILTTVFRIAGGRMELMDWLLEILTGLVPVIRSVSDDDLFKPMNQEALFRCYTQINRLRGLVEQGRLDLQTATLGRLLRSILSTLTVPFHGEPVLGMQIMGLLETRNLDFRHVLLLSAGEGYLPGTSKTTSFIPYNLRMAFGLSTMNDRSAVVSYNFHHLLQRSESVTMVYNSDSNSPGLSRGQISRYLLQLQLSGRGVEMLSLKTERKGLAGNRLTVKKTPQVLESLRNKFNADCNPKSLLSPSALKKYLACPLEFYLAQVAGLKKDNTEVSDIDVAMFGTLFHKSAELIYGQLAGSGSGRVITAAAIDAVIKSKTRIADIVCSAFNTEYFGKDNVPMAEYSGSQTIVHGVIKRYLTQILKMDRDFYAPFEYIQGESDEYERIIRVNDPCNKGQTMNVRLKGIIDRMDRKNGILRIVDYKTGTKRKMPSCISDLFERDGKAFDHAFQIFYYAYLLGDREEMKNTPVAPMLLYTRATSKPVENDLYYYVGNDRVEDFEHQFRREFEGMLMELVNEIFNPDKDFHPTDAGKNSAACRYCDFFSLCYPGESRPEF